ncbi:ABC transporter ATP-binding protein [Clostridium gelidum]|uniref:ABC transporter ATP-binding protein n=1 Tax=Clostridium gelidum TaxID=704125 RepID=A0ABN6IT63_9CLOT|nr:ABC transporter ATP-binding protein [Clostridium gelidum]BCZ45397.1 ABC transporter ATP-binding protein [Clostridium gelidum]
MLEFKNVTFKYLEYDYEMLNDLSFSVEKGEFVSIIGASGCGKSTIFRLINGLEKMQSGEIFINEDSIKNLKNYSAYMPQKDLLFPWRTIGDNLSLPMEIQKIKKSDRENRVLEILKEVGLSDYKDKFPKELSGGMRQRVSFARTLLTGSELLLLDEPFSALDSLTRILMQEWLLEEWKHFNKTILFITHDVEEAIFLSKSIFVIQDNPITHMERIEVPLEYPRSRSSMQKPEIIELKESLISRLRQKVNI